MMTRGIPDKTFAIIVATIAFAFFFAIALLILLLPKELTGLHIIFACIAWGLALLMYPWQLLDVKNREYIFDEASFTYKMGILTRFSAELPFSSISGFSVKQGILQRIVGCANIRITALGIQDPHSISSSDTNSITLYSVKNFDEISQVLREKLKEKEGSDNAAE